MSIHDDAAVLQIAAEHVAPGLSDHDVAVINISPVAGDRRSVSGKRDHCRACSIPGTVLIISGEVRGIRVLLRVFIHDLCDPQRFSVHEQDRQYKAADNDGNADLIKSIMR